MHSFAQYYPTEPRPSGMVQPFSEGFFHGAAGRPLNPTSWKFPAKQAGYAAGHRIGVAWAKAGYPLNANWTVPSDLLPVARAPKPPKPAPTTTTGAQSVSVTPELEAAVPGITRAANELIARFLPGATITLTHNTVDTNGDARYKHANGWVRSNGLNKWYIALNTAKGRPKEGLVRTLFHEFGHIVMWTRMQQADQQTRDAIERQWRAEREQVSGTRSLFQDLEGTTAGRALRTAPSDDEKARAASGYFNTKTPKTGGVGYELNMDEWIAEKSMIWLNTAVKPKTVAAKFFQSIATTLQEMYRSILAAFGLPVPAKGALERVLSQTWGIGISEPVSIFNQGQGMSYVGPKPGYYSPPNREALNAAETGDEPAATMTPQEWARPPETQFAVSPADEGVVSETTASPDSAAPDSAAPDTTQENSAEAPLADASFASVSVTQRQSIFRQAFREAGHDPAEAENYPPAKQAKVLADLISRSFGLKTDVRPTAVSREAIDQMLDAYRNLRWMAHSLALPANAMSLYGRVSLSLTKWNGRWLGLYDPAARSIHLPGRSNSFAHEWAHALDHRLITALRQQDPSFTRMQQMLATRNTLSQGLGPNAQANPDTATAFAEVLTAMYLGDASRAATILSLQTQLGAMTNVNDPARRALQQRLDAVLNSAPSDYLRGAQNLSPAQAAYFTNPAEMFARAVEAYVGQKVAAAGGTNEFITKGDEAYLSNADRRLRLSFPKDVERDNIFLALDRLFDALRREGIMPGTGTAAPIDTDIVDPHRWHRAAPSPGDRGVAGAMRRLAEGIKRDFGVLVRMPFDRGLRAETAERVGLDPNAPVLKNRPVWHDRGRDPSRALFISVGSRMHVIAERQRNAPARDALRKVAYLFSPKPGAGEQADAVAYERAVDRTAKAHSNRIGNILIGHGLEKMDPATKEVLHAELRGQTAARGMAVPRNVRDAAAEIRKVLVDVWYAARTAGVDVGYAKETYMPRVLEDALVMEDKARFIKQAALVYGDQFDERVAAGEAPEDLAHEVGVSRAVAARMKPADVRKVYAAFNAQGWARRINTAGDLADFDSLGPDSSFTSGRTLPESADRHLAEFYVQDPVEVLHRYLLTAARKTEFIRRTGPGGERLQALLDEAADADAYMDDIDTLKKLINVVAGRGAQGDTTRGVERVTSFIYAAGTLALMPRAAFTSLAEPVFTLVRTRDVQASMRTLSGLMREVVRNADSDQRQEMANALGLVTNSHYDTIMVNRMTGGVGHGTKLERLLTNFFERTYLTALTNAQRRAALGGADVYVRHLARDAVTKTGIVQEKAMAELRGLGVPPADVGALHAFLSANPTVTVSQIDAGMGRVWGDAVSNVVDEVIQNPMRVDKPELASNPLARLLYGLMSFSFSFARNAHMRILRDVVRTQKVHGLGASAQTVAGYGIATVGFLTATALGSMFRDALFASTRPDEKDDEWWKRQITTWLSRGGVFGAADPLVQAWNGVRYERDLSAIMAGAQIGYLLSAAQNIIQPWAGRNSDGTNTAERNSVKGAIQLFAVPALGAAMAAVPGGPLTSLGFMSLTSSRGVNAATDAIAGPRQTRPQGSGDSQGGMGSLGNLGNLGRL
jgi:Zn-dependent peptidase ImmA (M78 family)